MKPLHRLGLASGLLTGLLATSGHYIAREGALTWTSSAQAQQPQSEEENKKQQQQQRQKQNPPPPPPQQKPPAPPPPRANVPPPPPPPRANPNPNPNPGFQQPGQPPSWKKDFGQPKPPPSQPPQPGQPPQQFKQVNPQVIPKGQPPSANQGTPPSSPGFVPKTPPSAGTPGSPPAANNQPPGQPRFLPRAPGSPPGTPPPGTPPQGFTKGPVNPPTTFLPKRLDEVQGQRKQRVEGNRTVIVEPGNRTIIKQDNRIIIRHDETERLRRSARDVRTTRGPGNTNQTFFLRPDGSRVVTVTDPSGRILHRYRNDRNGRQVTIIDNRRFYRNVAIGVGVGLLGAAILYNLPRPVVDIPRERYIVDYDRASDDDLYEALTAPPLMRMERAYSLEEIRDNYSLRERVRSIDLDNITFDSGSFEVTEDQYRQLERIARVISRVLSERPDEAYLIEGHTDATGTAEDNLSLSDRRAQAVAQVLSEQFGVPPENLVTQGYGEQFLKVDTSGPERLNRRVTVRPIKSLMGRDTSEYRQ
jgi:outer membrane protein OmpA-like peptidoglycan-associated protein